jgi:two-component system cell cycle response regulator DivK
MITIKRLLLFEIFCFIMKYNILVIEDDEMNLDMITQRLELRGYRVLGASDGLDGIDLAREEQPDLILMDVNLPEIDGWETTRRLKAEPATRNIPVVALTAHAMVSDRDKALQAGCDDYETKPVDFQRLLSKIGALLVNRQSLIEG